MVVIHNALDVQIHVVDLANLDVRVLAKLHVLMDVKMNVEIHVTQIV